MTPALFCAPEECNARGLRIEGRNSRMYSRGPLKWPKLLQVDPGREFMGSVPQTLAKHGVAVRRSEREAHRGQAIVERFNRTVAERLFGHQHAQEMQRGGQRDRGQLNGQHGCLGSSLPYTMK